MKATIKDRIVAHRSAPDVYEPPSFEQMADRIEKLELDNKRLRLEEADAWATTAAAIERVKQLEANLAKAAKDCIKELEWRVWHGGNHSKCGRFVVLPEGKMFRLTHAKPDVKLDLLVKQSCLYTSRETAMEQANALHQNEILGWLESGTAELTGGKDE